MTNRREPLIDVQNLRVSFARGRSDVTEVVHGVDLRINPGEVVALVGQSGSGKSVTARSLVGLAGDGATVTAERLQVLGKDARGFRDRDFRSLRGRDVGLVLQDALVSLDPLKKLGREVGEALRIHRLQTRKESRRSAITALEEVGLDRPQLRAEQYPHQLSGGQRQRALIAAGIAARPSLLIADEPTTALDVTVQAQIIQLLKSLQRADNGLLFISHDLGVVSELADRVIVMHDGVVEEQGATREVLYAPNADYTRSLIAAIPSSANLGLRLTSDSSTDRVPLPQRVIERDDVVLRATGLSKHFRVGGQPFTAVDDVSLELSRGETLGVVGESGSGKSTVAKILLGLTEPDAGTVHLGDFDWTSAGERARRPHRRSIQSIAQDPLSSFDPRYTVRRVLREPLALLTDRSSSQADQRIHELLDLVGLERALLDRHPRTLSGGQRQRVAIARALSVDPAILVADEPVSALDVSIQAQVLDLLADIQHELQTSIVFISHDLGVIRHVSDRIIVLQHGVLVEQGAADRVFTAPQHPYTRQLLNALPPFERDRAEETVHA